MTRGIERYFVTPSEYLEIDMKDLTYVTKSISPKECLFLHDDYFVDTNNNLWRFLEDEERLIVTFDSKPIVNVLIPWVEEFIVVLYIDGTTEIVPAIEEEVREDWIHVIKDQKRPESPKNIKKLCFTKRINEGKSQGNGLLYCIDFNDNIKVHQINTDDNVTTCTELDVFSENFKAKDIQYDENFFYITDMNGVVWSTGFYSTLKYIVGMGITIQSVLMKLSESVDISMYSTDIFSGELVVCKTVGYMKRDRNTRHLLSSLHKFSSEDKIVQIKLVHLNCFLVLYESGHMDYVTELKGEMVTDQVFFNIKPIYFTVHSLHKKYITDPYQRSDEGRFIIAKDSQNNVEIVRIKGNTKKLSLPPCNLINREVVQNRRWVYTKSAV